MNKIIFHKSLKELRVILCQNSSSSQSLREFIRKYYVHLKTNNPNISILIRECQNIQPKIYARFDHGEEKCMEIMNKNVESILKDVSNFVNVK